MRTRRVPAATLLLILLYLTTESVSVNGQLAKLKRALAFRTKQTVSNEKITVNQEDSQGSAAEHLVSEPERINNAILSNTQRQGVFPNSDNLDQQVDQSQTVIITTGDIENLENIDALSFIEYEPQKINTKKKRRIVGPSSDSPVFSSENLDRPAPTPGTIYYEVPRTVQPKNIYYAPTTVVTPKYFSRSHEIQKSLQDEANPSLTTKKLKLGETVEYVYPVPTKATKPRFRPQYPKVSSTEASKLENTPSRSSPLHRVYAPVSSDTRKSKYTVDSVVTTTPSNTLYSTKTPRRRKIRKRIADKSSSSQDTTGQGSNEGSSAVRIRSSVNPEARKSRRSGFSSKHDVAPRPFSKHSQTTLANQEGTLEKLEEGVVSGGSRGSNNRNPHPNGLKSIEEPNRSALTSFNRKLYERTVNRGPVTKEPKSEYENSKVSSEISAERAIVQEDSQKDRNPKTEAPQSAYGNSLDVSTTPSSVEIYQNIKSPVVTLHSGSSGVSVQPYTSPSPYSDSLVFYPPVISTLSPVQYFEASTEYSIAPQPTLKERDVETNDKEQKSEIDGVAEATNQGSEESGLEGGKYEIQGTSEEGHQGEDHGERGYQYEQNADGNSSDGPHGDHQHDKEKYDEKDVQGASSQHSHQDSKDSAGSGKENGGDGKFEHGEGTARQEGHKETEGDKGHKGYKSWHEHEKANKGHHDKERHNKSYDEKDGKEKGEKEDGEYHEDREEGEKEQKQAEFGEKGEHQKGYSTKGQHSVHKKDEFEKRTEFFDEFSEDGELEKDGEYYEEHEMMKGGHEKSSHHDEDDHEDKYGKASKYEKGGHHHEDKGHKISEGEDDRYEHEDAQGKKHSSHKGKKWTYRKGDDGTGGDHKPKR